METNALHITLLKSLRLLFLTFVLSLGANVALGQAKLLNPNGNDTKEQFNDPPGGKWRPDGKSDCNHLKPRLSYLCGGESSGSSKFMISLQRISKEEGEIEIAKGQGVGWNYRTCLSISYDKDWMTDNASGDKIDEYYPDIVYAYSVGNMDEGFNVYYYVSDDKSPTPTNNDDDIKPLLVGDAQNLFQNGKLPKNINGSKEPLLQTLDLSGWDFSGVTSLVRFFSNANRLTNVTFGTTVNLTKLENAYQMFNACKTISEETLLNFFKTWIVDSKYDEDQRMFVVNEIFDNRMMFTAGCNAIKNNKTVETANTSIKYTKQGQGLNRPSDPSYNFDPAISYINADKISTNLEIKWDDIYENLISKFEIYYSLDNETYIKIDEVDADSQDTAAYMFNSYTYTWENVPYDFLRAKKYEIKIKMIDVSDDEIDIMSFLPIELTYFEVLQNGNELFFEWETATETNNDYFTIEQSLDGVSFHEIARITGAGTTSSYTLYEYSYPISIEGIVYFRLKQTDYNGDYSYSNIKTIDVVGNSPLRMYPIPALAYITIEGDYESVQFVDVNGVIHTPQRAEGNTYPLTSFPKGMFFAIVTLKNGEIVTRQFLHK